MTRRGLLPLVVLGLAALLAACGGGSGDGPAVGAEPPPSTPSTVLAWADIEDRLVGSFAVPAASEPSTDYRFGYSDAVHAQLADGTLLVTGHPWYPMQARVRLPAVLDGREGERVGDWFDATDGLLPTGWEDGAPAFVLGDAIEIGDRLFFTKHQWYNGAGTDWETQGVRERGVARGLWRLDHPLAHHSRVGGFMTRAPAALAAGGVTYLAGLEGTSGAALGRWGPNLFAVRADPARPPGSAWSATPLVCHDTQAHAPETWWIGDKVSDVVWIETATQHAVLMFVVKKRGATWYGEAHEGGDPYGGGKGYHAEGWAVEAWIYDPADLLAVYRGEADPWTPRPVERIVLTERAPGSDAETYFTDFLRGEANDALKASLRDGRLIVLQPEAHRPGAYEGMPMGYVFDLAR